MTDLLQQLQKAIAGLSFQSTQGQVTLHGPRTNWHRYKGRPWNLGQPPKVLPIGEPYMALTKAGRRIVDALGATPDQATWREATVGHWVEVQRALDWETFRRARNHKRRRKAGRWCNGPVREEAQANA